MMNFIKFLILLSLGVFIAIFSYQNMTEVQVNVYQYSYKLPLFVVIFGCFIAGFLIPTVYYYFKNMQMSHDINFFHKVLTLYSKGSLKNLANLLKKHIKAKHFLSVLFSEVYKNSGRIDEGIKILETVRQNQSSTFIEYALGQLYFKKGLIDEALTCLRQSVSFDFKNLRAHRLLRDVSFLKGNLPEAITAQRNILKIVEKEEAKKEGDIMGSLLAYASLKEEDIKEKEKLLKESVRYSKNPLNITASILLNLEKGKENTAQQLFEESFHNGMQNGVIALLLNYEEKLPYFLNIIREKEGRINLEVLARAYIALNMYEPLKEKADTLPEYIRVMVEAGESHVEKDKRCFNVLKEAYPMWECKCCGTKFREYTPMCTNCMRWNCIDILSVKG